MDSNNANENVLQEADRLTARTRNQTYGNAATEFAKVGKMWEVIIGHTVSAKQVAMCMAALKLVREAHQAKRDNLVDACGYLRLAHDVETGVRAEDQYNGPPVKAYPVVPTPDL